MIPTPERPEIHYPCTWVYKVIGSDSTALEEMIIAACSPLEVIISQSHSSSKGKYHSLNVQVIVPDESVRLKIYDTLTAHSLVKIVL